MKIQALYFYSLVHISKSFLPSSPASGEIWLSWQLVLLYILYFFLTYFFSQYIFLRAPVSGELSLGWQPSTSPLTEMEIAEAKNGQVSNVCRNILKAPNSQTNKPVIKLILLWMLFCFDLFVSNLSFNVVTKHFIIHMKDYYKLWPYQSLTGSLAQGFCFEGRLARPVDGWHGAGSMRQTILALIHWAKAEWCIQWKENTHDKTHLLLKRNRLEV